jgi:hypothetical protein
MTRLSKGQKDLAKLKGVDLPPYCVPRYRKNYAVVYFCVPDHCRPDNWKPSYEVGRTDKHTIKDIIDRGNDLYKSLLNVRKSHELQTPYVRTGSLPYLIARYKKSEHYLNLKPATQKSYDHHLKTIRRWSEECQHPHIRQLTPAGIKAFLDRWMNTPRTRKFYKAVLSKLFQVAIEESFIELNIVRQYKLPKGNKKKQRYKVWKSTDIDMFAVKADEIGLPNVGTAVVVAWEAFRQTDVFGLQEPRDYKQGAFRFETSKTGETVSVRASQRTVNRLAKRPKEQLLLTVNDLTKRPWTKDAYHKQFRKVCDACGLQGYVFKRIRNSAAINALKADLTEAEFQQRFGWSKDDVKAMRDLYTDIDQDILDTGAKKLARLEKS